MNDARSTNGDDLVSVIIPSKNRQDLLPVAVQSVLDQTHANVEVVVIDDGSQPPINLASTDPRIVLIRKEQTPGVAYCRNIGLNVCNGRFIAFLDDDDYYYPNKLEHQLAYLRENPDVEMVFSKVCVVDQEGNERFYLDDAHQHSVFENFLRYNVIHTNATLLRRSVIDKVRFDERLTKYTDTQFFLAVTLACRVAYLPIPVATWFHNCRPDQLSNVSFRRNYRNFKLICEIFQDTILRHPRLRRRYFGRAGYQALRCFDFLAAIRFLWKIVGPVGRGSETS